MWQLLLAGVNNITTRNLALVHKIIHHLQLRQTNRLERGVDQSSSIEVKSPNDRVSPSDITQNLTLYLLGCILTVTDI